MNAIVIPVKSIEKSKQRLGRRFATAEREALSLAMFRDVLASVAASHRAEHVFIVTSDERVIREMAKFRVRTQGPSFEIIPEESELGENGAVKLSTEIALRRRVTSLLVLPADIPLVRPDDVDALFDVALENPGALFVPSRDRDGTNALLRRPPDVLSPRFGPGSFARHRSDADRMGVRTRVVENSRIELDIDTPHDVSLFASIRSRTETYRTLFKMRYF
ncbi:MAG: 2-phospho-L-lactate guanylyltransferase [Vicinamibacteria bacterium]